MSEYFGLLFARPSFLEGIGRVFDLGNTLSEYNRALTPGQADLLALRADIAAVRADYEIARQKAMEEQSHEGVQAPEQLSLF